MEQIWLQPPPFRDVFPPLFLTGKETGGKGLGVGDLGGGGGGGGDRERNASWERGTENEKNVMLEE